MNREETPTPKVGDIWEKYDAEYDKWLQYEVVEELTVQHLLEGKGVVLLAPMLNLLYWNPNEYRKVRDANDTEEL